MPPTTLGNPTLGTPTLRPYLSADWGGGACLGVSPGAEPRAPAAQGMRSAFYSASRRRGGARSHIPRRYRALPALCRLHPNARAWQGHPWAMGGAPREPVAPCYLLGCPGQGGMGRRGGEAEPCAWGPAAPRRPPNPFPGTFYAPSPQDCLGDSGLKCLPAPKIAFGGGCVRLPSSGLLWQCGTVSSSTRHELLVYCRVLENKG